MADQPAEARPVRRVACLSGVAVGVMMQSLLAVPAAAAGFPYDSGKWAVVVNMSSSAA